MSAVRARIVFCLGLCLLLLSFVPYGAECRSETRDAKLTKPLVVAPAPIHHVDAEGATESTPVAGTTTAPVQDGAGPRARKSFGGGETTARIERSSRGRQRFQPLDNAIDEPAKAKGPKPGVNDTADVTQAMATTVASATQTSVENGSRRSSENATTGRAGKASNFRVGGDGYVFEKTFDMHPGRTDSNEEYAYEPLQEHPAAAGAVAPIHENNIDRIRNYNEAVGNVRITNNVKKPQGFTLTTETTPPLLDPLYRRPPTAAISSYAYPMATKKRITNSVVSDSAPVVSLTRPGPAPASSSSTENTNPTSISKNEIVRKPSAKPTFSSRRRVTPGVVSVSENSLPTTAAVWALTALKTPTNFKSVQKRPSNLEIARKPIIEHKATSMLPSTTKPFVPWSTRLQHRTTTEEASDPTTTFRPTLEVDAETLSPIALQGPKLMNLTDVRGPPVMLAATHRVMNESKNHVIVQSVPVPVVNVSTTPPPSTIPITVVTEEDMRIDLTDVVNPVQPHVKTTDKAATEPTMVNSTQAPVLADKEDPSDNGAKPPFDLLKDILVNNSSFVVAHADEQKDVIMLPVPSSTPAEITTTNLNANNPLITEHIEHEQPIPATNGSKSGLPESNARPVAVGPAENAESNVIYEQNMDAAMKPDVKSRAEESALKKKSALLTAPALRNVTEEKEKISTWMDTVLSISNHHNNSVLADETHAPHIPIFEDEDESAERSNTTTTMAAANVTSPAGLEDEFKMNKANGLSYPVSAPPPLEELLASTSTLPSTVLKLSTSTSADVATVRIYHTKAPPATSDVASTTTSTVATTSTTANTTIVTSATPSSKSASSSQPPPTVTTWLTSKEEMSTDFLTTSSPSSSSTAAISATTSANGKYEDLDVDGYADSDEAAATTLANEVHRQSTTSQPSSSESFSSSSASSSEEIATPLSTDTLTSTSGPTTVPTEPLPMAPPFKPNLPPENVPGYLMLFLKSSFADICQPSSALRENLFQYITQRSRVQSKDQVVMVIDPERCKEPDHSLRIIPVALYLVDDFGSYDKTLIDEMKKLLEEEGANNYSLPQIHEIVYYENIAPDNSRVIAAMVITSIAAICFVLLIFLMCTIRNRQKSNYGQRCTPVSADDYNLDNISEYNSIRRKHMMRASKRSYGNLAFDDPTGPSKVLTYNGLLKACESRCSLDEEFSQIPVVTVKPIELPPGAEVKNRYANVIPLPETRVCLSPTNACSDLVIDYINANYVKGFKDADRFYIACQAPLSNTIEDFWKMVWKEQTKVIIMLTGLTENGVEKCADYLPPSEVLDCHRLFGDYQITLKKREVKEKYVISSLQLKNMETNLWREVHHLWYTNWPAQGVPSEQSSIIAFLIEARAYMRNTSGPHVVHCCPGTGRTGTVLTIDICIREYEMSRTVNIPATVAKLRRCRAGSVQTKEQYAFIYKVLALYAKKLHGGAPLDSI